MAGAVDISQSDMEGRFGALLVSRVFCDDGSGRAGPRLYNAVVSGRRIADAHLLRAWTEEQIEVMIAEDYAVMAPVLDIIMSEGMAGRMEWDVAGGPRERLRKLGETTLKLLADAELKSIAENHGAGKNPHATRVRVNTERSPHTFVFAPSRAKPVRGGF